MKKLGLFGGSFDPVHVGHILLARYAREALKLDEVWFIPCSESADGKRLAPGRLRLKWLRKALRGEEGLKASDLEFKRGGVSRTIDTLRQLRAELGSKVKFTLLLGQDQYQRIATWKEASKIPEQAQLAVFGRPTSPKITPKKFLAFHLRAPLFQISSSEIRLNIRRHRDISLLVPPSIQNDPDLGHFYGKVIHRSQL